MSATPNMMVSATVFRRNQFIAHLLHGERR
jgi:hypothetical protein